MRRTLISLSPLGLVILTAGPALAAEVGDASRPWHYWIAPFLLGGAVLALAALGIGYYVRVMGGRTRR